MSFLIKDLWETLIDIFPYAGMFKNLYYGNTFCEFLDGS